MADQEKKEYREKIFIKETEYLKLINDFGKEDVERMLDTMEDYLLAHGKKYKDYYRAIRMWIRNDRNRMTNMKTQKIFSEEIKKKNIIWLDEHIKELQRIGARGDLSYDEERAFDRIFDFTISLYSPNLIDILTKLKARRRF